ncbi:MAG TPA: hypothetical protein HPQ04_03430 [Rhodospirillaceae bacterium]|nr:hypothetical protein [Rhodospirillaceae bacterium]
MVDPHPPRAVLRIQKITTTQAMDRLSRHDRRVQPVANDEPGRGGIVCLTPEATDPAAAVRAEISSLDKPPRKNAVLCYQAILTTGDSHFGVGPERIARAERFTAAAMAWARENLPGKVVSAYRHDGEVGGPHLHVWVVPVVETEIAVNRKRPELGKRPCRRLDYDGLFGGSGKVRNKAIMENLQRGPGGIGAALAPLGIAMPQPKAKTNATHTETMMWKANQKAAMEMAGRMADAAINDRERAGGILDAWDTASRAVGSGDIVGIDHRAGGPVIAFSQSTSRAKADEVLRKIEPARSEIMGWLEAFFRDIHHIRKRAEDDITRIIRKASKTINIQSAAALASRLVRNIEPWPEAFAESERGGRERM